MAICIPDQPAFVTVSEREVWQKLRKQLSDTAYCSPTIASQTSTRTMRLTWWP